MTTRTMRRMRNIKNSSKIKRSMESGEVLGSGKLSVLGGRYSMSSVFSTRDRESSILLISVR